MGEFPPLMSVPPAGSSNLRMGISSLPVYVSGRDVVTPSRWTTRDGFPFLECGQRIGTVSPLIFDKTVRGLAGKPIGMLDHR